MDRDALQKLISDEVEEIDHPYFIVSGYFLAWYALVEIHITAQLAFLAGVKELDVFHVVSKGMDARVKLERLRQLVKTRNQTIGPNLTARLLHFEKAIVPIRNRLSHGAPWHNETEIGKFHLISVANFSATMTSGTWSTDSLNEGAGPLLATELLEHGRWLRVFCADLTTLLAHPEGRETLEIDHPQTPLPKASRPGHSQSSRRATPRKPPKKRP